MVRCFVSEICWWNDIFKADISLVSFTLLDIKQNAYLIMHKVLPNPSFFISLQQASFRWPVSVQIGSMEQWYISCRPRRCRVYCMATVIALPGVSWNNPNTTHINPIPRMFINCNSIYCYRKPIICTADIMPYWLTEIRCLLIRQNGNSTNNGYNVDIFVELPSLRLPVLKRYFWSIINLNQYFCKCNDSSNLVSIWWGKWNEYAA